MKKIVLILIMILSTEIMNSQSISPYVINTTGGGGSTGGADLYFNIGEPLISTIGNGTNTITQGFLQPIYGKFNLLASYTVSPISCIGKKDGSIVISKYYTGMVPQSLSYQIIWNNDTTLCPNKDCDVLSQLSAGTYSVMVIAYDGVNPIDTVVINDIVIFASSEPCKIKPFTYISANNDGQNDIFVIENIEEYPENEVYIFNRWGQQIVHIKGYDNSLKAWGAKDYPITVTSGTYYYLIDLDGQGKDLMKGFLELVKD